jgi:hypothetical protein
VLRADQRTDDGFSFMAREPSVCRSQAGAFYPESAGRSDRSKSSSDSALVQKVS